MYKIVIAIILNCIMFYIWAFSDCFRIIYENLNHNYEFILEKIPLIIISCIFSFIGNKTIKEKIWDFIKISIFSYIGIFIMVAILFIHSMSNFD